MTDIAKKDYWDTVWKTNRYDPFNTQRYIHRRLNELFLQYVKKGNKVIEMGCANSQLLPFLKAYFEVEITGVDYSETGVKNLQDFLHEKNLKADLYCCDFRSLPDKLFAGYDVLYSFGVVEHFTDYHQIIRHFSKFLRDDGIIITIIPNLASRLYGYAQKKLSYNIYKKHVIIDREMLCKAHRGDFKIIHCDYFGSFDPSLINYHDAHGFRRVFLDAVIGFLSRAVAPLVNLAHIGDSSEYFSNYILCVARKLQQ